MQRTTAPTSLAVVRQSSQADQGRGGAPTESERPPSAPAPPSLLLTQELLRRRLQQPETSRREATPQELLTLQRLGGNRAVVARLADRPTPSTGPTVAIRRSPEMIRRAIGFEFEFGTWRTTHVNDRSRLDKGEKVVKGDGYKIEGEDATDGVSSAIEVVTDPYTTVDEATKSIGEAQATLKDMDKDAKQLGAPLKANDYPQGVANVDIVPGPGEGKMQASPAISLDRMNALYKEGINSSGAIALEKELGKQEFKDKWLGGKDASPELLGFLTLIMSYLEEGTQTDPYGYPKSAFTIMARTSFTKMFSLVPEHEFFGNPENAGLWTDMVLTVSQKMFAKFREEYTPSKLKKKSFFSKKWVTVPEVRRPRSLAELKDQPVLNMPLTGMEALPGHKEGTAYQSTVTRDQWLGQMSQQDLLSKATDKRYEGMGAYGDATDQEVLDDQPKGKVPDTGELGTGDLVKGTEEAVLKAVEQVGIPEPEEIVEPKEEPKDEEEPVRMPKQAPLFELRGMRDSFGIDQTVSVAKPWTDQVTAVFDLVDKANGRSFKAGGKPVVPDDVDNKAVWKKTKAKKRKNK